MELYIAILIGAVINLLLGFNEALGKADYRFWVFLQQNTVATILNIIIGCSIVYGRDDPMLSQVVGDITFLTAVFIGSSGQFIWKKITNIFNSQKSTLIGKNGKPA